MMHSQYCSTEAAGYRHPYWRHLPPPRSCNISKRRYPKVQVPCSEQHLRPWVADYLTPYQQDAVNRAAVENNFMLYWPCGVGKTVGSVAAVEQWRTQGARRVLAVTKAGTRAQFRREIEKLTYHKVQILRGQTPTDIETDSWAVISWEILPYWLTTLQAWQPDVLVLDEIHTGKNKSRWQRLINEEGRPYWKLKENRVAAAYALSRQCRYRLGLTATPIAKDRSDLWGQLDFLEPDGWGKFKDFAMRYCDAAENSWGGLDTGGKSESVEFKARLMTVMSIVDQREAAKHLPALRTQTVYLGAEDQCRPVGGFKKIFSKAAKSGAMALREAKLAEAASRKRLWLKQVVTEAWSHDQKVVAFFGRREIVERVGEEMTKAAAKVKDKTIPVFVAHGGYTDNARDQVLQDYVNHDGPCLFVGSYQAFGEAYDGFQCTDLAVQAMLPSTPRETIQARGRFRRLGGNGCLILYPVAEGTVDEHIASVLLERLEDVVDISGDTDVGELVSSLGLEDAEDEILASILMDEM